MRMLLLLIASLLALWGHPAMAYSPAPAQPCVNGYNFVGASPARLSIKCFGGFADAEKGASHYGASTTFMTMQSIQTLTNVSVTTNSTTQVTLTPAYAAPNIAGLGTTSMKINATGITGALILTSNPATGVVVCSGCTFNTVTGDVETVTITQNDADTTVGLAGRFLGSITVSSISDGNGPYGTQIVASQVIFPYAGGNGPSTDGAHICLRIPGGTTTDWCGTAVNEPNADGETVQLTGDPLAGSSTVAPPIFNGTQTLDVYWGYVLFRPNDTTACNGTGRSLEIPGAANTTDTFTGANTAFETSIVAYSSPLSVTLAGSVTRAVSGLDGEVTIGCDDFPAYQAASNYIVRQGKPTQPQELYFPGNSFLASAIATSDAWQYVLQCGDGEGTVLWPSPLEFSHGAAQCGLASKVRTAPFSDDITPSLNLKQMSSLAPGSTAKIVVIGNSAITIGTNTGGTVSSWYHAIIKKFQQEYGDLNIVGVPLAIGGTNFSMAAPGGFDNGIITKSPAAVPTWYTDETKPYMNYVRDQNPDVVIMQFTNVGGENFDIAAMIDTIQYTQTAAWKSTTGRNPDIILANDAWQPQANAQQAAHGIAAGFVRSYVKACVAQHTAGTWPDKLANGGCPGLIDSGRMMNMVMDGWDPEDMPMRRTQALPLYQGGRVTTFPWKYTTPRRALDGYILPKETGGCNPCSPTTWFSAIGGEIDFYLHGGANVNPQALTYSVSTTADAAAGQAVVTVGSFSSALSAGLIVTGSSKIPANTSILSVNTGAGTFTLTANLTGTGTAIASGTALTFAAQGPSNGYPGGILRISRNSGTGFLQAQYDTVYFQSAGSDCSGTAGAGSFTCTTAEVGIWDRFLSVSIPTALDGTNPQVTYIAGVSMDGKTVTLPSGVTLGHNFTNQQLTVYRTSVPLTQSLRSADSGVSNNDCGGNGTTALSLQFRFSVRGSSAGVTYCDANTPGYMVFEGNIERFDSPFQFAIDSPTHFSSTGGIQFVGGGLAGTTIGSPSYWYESSEEYPAFEPTLRMVPDVYNYCQPTAPFGQWAPWAGQCDNHRGYMGLFEIDQPLLNGMHFR